MRIGRLPGEPLQAFGLRALGVCRQVKPLTVPLTLRREWGDIPLAPARSRKKHFWLCTTTPEVVKQAFLTRRMRRWRPDTHGPRWGPSGPHSSRYQPPSVRWAESDPGPQPGGGRRGSAGPGDDEDSESEHEQGPGGQGQWRRWGPQAAGDPQPDDPQPDDQAAAAGTSSSEQWLGAPGGRW